MRFEKYKNLENPIAKNRMYTLRLFVRRAPLQMLLIDFQQANETGLDKIMA